MASYLADVSPNPRSALLDESGLSATRGQQLAFEVDVPQNASQFAVSISGGTGDADLYVRVGDDATLQAWDCRPYRSGNEESCPVEGASGERVFILLNAYTDFTGVRLVAEADVVDTTVPPVNDDPGGDDGNTGNSGNSDDVVCDFQRPVKSFKFETSTHTNALEELYADHRTTFYCGCAYSSNKTIQSGCGYKKPSGGTDKQNWEHLVAAFRMNRDRPCRNQCSNKSPRDCCRAVDAEFRQMEGDLHHLVPAEVNINSVRSSHDFGIVAGEAREFGTCDFEDDGDFAEPAPHLRGNIARIFFYYESVYGMTLTSQERTTMTQWNLDDPVDEDELDRNDRIEAIQGNRNPYVDAGLDGATCGNE
ncbi:MAG: endonuclease [Polyangiales bacterium]